MEYFKLSPINFALARNGTMMESGDFRWFNNLKLKFLAFIGI